MKFEINIISAQPLQPSTMDDWSTSSKASWAPINCNMATLLHILLQRHPLGSLSEFRINSPITLQQRSQHGTSLGPQCFNHGDNPVDRRSRKISHLIYRATGLQLPGTPLTLYSHPCQDPASHPIRTGTSQRPVGLNELVRNTSFVLLMVVKMRWELSCCSGTTMKTIPDLWHSCLVNCQEHSTPMMLVMWRHLQHRWH